MSASYRLQFAEDMEDRLLDNPEAVEKILRHQGVSRKGLVPGLHFFRDDVGGPVVVLDVLVGLFGVCAHEAFLLVAVGQPWAQDRLVLLQVDLVGVEVLEHLVQRLDAFLRVAVHLFADFINRGSFPDPVGDVGLVNHYGAEVAVEDVCVELAGFA